VYYHTGSTPVTHYNALGNTTMKYVRQHGWSTHAFARSRQRGFVSNRRKSLNLTCAAVTSQWNRRLDHAKHDRHCYRTKMLMKKCRRAKNRKSRRQRQSGAAENTADLQLGVTMQAWHRHGFRRFEAALLDVNGSPEWPDLPDISITWLSVTAVFFIFSVNNTEHLYLKCGVARVSCSKSARHWLRRMPPSNSTLLLLRHLWQLYRHGLWAVWA